MRDNYVYLESAQCTTKRASFIPYVFEFSALFFFVLPISLIIVLYVLIGIQLRRSSSMHHSSTSAAGKDIDSHQFSHSHQAYLPHCTSSSNHPTTFQFNQHHSNHQPQQQQSSKSKGVSTASSSASSSSSNNNKNAKDQYQRTVSLSNASNAQLSRQNASRRSVIKMLGE